MFKWRIVALYFFIVAFTVLLKTGSSLFYVLPLIVSIFTFILSKHLATIGTSQIIHLFYAQFIVRYSFIPLLYNENILISNYNEVYFVMVYELIFIFLAIYFFTKKTRVFNWDKGDPNLEILKFSFKAKLILFLFFAYLIVNYAEVKNTITFLGSSSNFIIESDSNNDLNSSGGYSGLVFMSFRFFLTLLLFSSIYQSKIRKDISKIMLLLLTTTIFSLFILGSSRFGILQYFIASICLIFYLFPNKKRVLYNLSGLLLLFVVAISTTYKFSVLQSNNTQTIDFNVGSYGMLNAYFAGPSNIDTGIKTLPSVENISNFDLLVSDIFINIPGLTRFSDLNLNTTKFFNNANYNTAFSWEDQIPPLVTFSAVHYSIYLSPFYSILFIGLALYCEKKSIKSRSIVFKSLFILLAIKFSFITMQNLSSIIGSIFLTYIIFAPMFLLKMNKRI